MPMNFFGELPTKCRSGGFFHFPLAAIYLLSASISLFDTTTIFTILSDVVGIFCENGGRCETMEATSFQANTARL